jgi:hypothetical protein
LKSGFKWISLYKQATRCSQTASFNDDAVVDALCSQCGGGASNFGHVVKPVNQLRDMFLDICVFYKYASVLN